MQGSAVEVRGSPIPCTWNLACNWETSPAVPSEVYVSTAQMNAPVPGHGPSLRRNSAAAASSALADSNGRPTWAGRATPADLNDTGRKQLWPATLVAGTTTRASRAMTRASGEPLVYPLDRPSAEPSTSRSIQRQITSTTYARSARVRARNR